MLEPPIVASLWAHCTDELPDLSQMPLALGGPRRWLKEPDEALDAVAKVVAGWLWEDD